MQSQIRTSTINELLEKVRKNSYGRYLRRLTAIRLRGFVGQSVSFDFPVTAIIGPNGGGKTTILGAAACAYRNIAPRRFFAKSGLLDNSMSDWSIEYEIVDKTLSTHDTVRRTASFKQLKWSRDAIEREVVVFGVSRTVPATERTDMVRYASNSFTFDASARRPLGSAASKAISRILGRDVSAYSQIDVSPRGQVTLLTGRTEGGVDYSEFHFGAGESSVARMVVTIEGLPENSLVLIEEIENGLHPVATRSMVEYLIEVAERKRIQTIFTTHSNDALSVLPDQAIWAASKSAVFQGKLDVESLRAVTGQIDKSLAVFVEDEFARVWVEAALRSDPSGTLYPQVEVHGLQGDGTAVAVNRHHNLDPSSSVPSICFIDGDSQQRDGAEDHVYRLPGASPEGHIFDSVLEAWGTIGGQLTVALLQPFEKTADVKRMLDEVRRDSMDEHVLYGVTAQRLGFIPEETVKHAFARFWCVAKPNAAADIRKKISGSLRPALQGGRR